MELNLLTESLWPTHRPKISSINIVRSEIYRQLAFGISTDIINYNMICVYIALKIEKHKCEALVLKGVKSLDN